MVAKPKPERLCEEGSEKDLQRVAALPSVALVYSLCIRSSLSLSTSSHNLIKHELSGCRRRSVSLLGYRLVSRAYGIGVGFVAVVVVWFTVLVVVP